MSKPNLAMMGDQDYTQPFTFEVNVMPSYDVEEGFGEKNMWEEGWKFRFGAPWCTIGCGDYNPYEGLEDIDANGAFEGVDEFETMSESETLYVYFKTEKDARQFCENLNKVV